MSSEQIKQRVNELSNELHQAIETYVQDPEQILELARWQLQFHQLSTRNTILVKHQYPGAIQTAGYKQWQKQGWQVRKGEKAIRVFAPSTIKEVFSLDGNYVCALRDATREQKQQITSHALEVRERSKGYITVPVFDLTQTNCPVEQYPKIYQQFYLLGSTEHFHALKDALDAYREQLGIGFINDPLAHQGGERGYFFPSANSLWVKQSLENRQYLKTYVHELTHSLLHKNTHLPRELQEYQAELAAGIVTNYYGMGDMQVNAAYIDSYLHGMDIKQKEQLISEVVTSSTSLITNVNKTLAQRYQLTPDMMQDTPHLQAANQSVSQPALQQETLPAPHHTR